MTQLEIAQAHKAAFDAGNPRECARLFELLLTMYPGETYTQRRDGTIGIALRCQDAPERVAMCPETGVRLDRDCD